MDDQQKETKANNEAVKADTNAAEFLEGSEDYDDFTSEEDAFSVENDSGKSDSIKEVHEVTNSNSQILQSQPSSEIQKGTSEQNNTQKHQNAKASGNNRLRQLLNQAAIAHVAIDKPASNFMSMSKSLLKFGRLDTMRHLTELTQRRNSWNAFEESHLKYVNHDPEKTKTQENENSEDEEPRTAMIVNASVPGTSLWVVNGNESHIVGLPLDLNLRGHQGVFSKLMGIYSPCNAKNGFARHNGELLYRLRRIGDLRHLMQG